VKGLILIDAAGMVPTRGEKFKAISMMRGAELGAPLAPKFRTAIASRPRLRNLAAPDPGFSPAFTAARRSWSDAWCDQLTEIECPTLIVWGERDALLPVRQGREWARRIRGSEFHVVPGVGHLPMLERPVLVNGLLEGFLKQLQEADC
jgi:pimeloyl-ACP methyl ester carboxylesterase